MIRSMTGFGRSSQNADGRELTIELKSVNHRFLDLSFRFPRSIAFLEDTARIELSSLVSRGHIDIHGYYRNTRDDSKSLFVDHALLSAYLAASDEICRTYPLENDLTLSRALRLADVVSVTETEDDANAIRELMLTALRSAAAELIGMRESEGARIGADLLSRIELLHGIRERIAERAPHVANEYRQRLNARVESLLIEAEIDHARLATEIALFADRANIDEELVRLSSHFEAAKELLNASEPVGRKLDFLVQEMNREFNTIGSKANDKLISALVIDGKAELEKLREQVQNLE